MRHLAAYIADSYRKYELLPNDTIDCLEYSLKALFNELSKVLIYALIFWTLDLLAAFLLSYVVFVSVRLFAGGIHCKTYWRCFFLSFFFIGGCVFSAQVIQGKCMVLLFVALVSCVMPLIFSPVTPSFRIIKDEKKKVVLKIIATLLSLVWVAIAFFTSEPLFANVIFLTVSTANYQLIVARFLQHRC